MPRAHADAASPSWCDFRRKWAANEAEISSESHLGLKQRACGFSNPFGNASLAPFQRIHAGYAVHFKAIAGAARFQMGGSGRYPRASGV